MEGSWVYHLKQCRRRLLRSTSQFAVCVNLTGVAYVDAAGKAWLAEMYERGAQFIVGDCPTKAIVARIVGDE